MAGKRLLIADDDKLAHQLYPQCLGGGYEYLNAFNGVDALVMALEQLPDLVVLDIAMPILDGRTVCKKLKSYPATRDAKIIMLSGRAQQHDRHLGFEVGADDYLEKPLSLPYLGRAVERRLQPAPGPMGA